MITHQTRKAIQQIHNNLYYQKLSPIISDLRIWLTQKDKLIDLYIIDGTRKILQSTINIWEQISEFCEQVSILLLTIVQPLSKINIESPKIKRIHSTHSKKSIQSKIKPQYFSKSSQLWLSRKQLLNKISTIAQVILSQIKKHTQQNGQVYQEYKSQGKKIKLNSLWSDTQYLKMFTIASLKNNHKQYQINKIQEMALMFTQQIKQYNTGYIKFCQLNSTILKNKQILLQTLHQNIINFTKIMKQCFKQFDFNLIQQSEQFIKNIKKHITDNHNKQKYIEEQKIKGAQELVKKLQYISKKALQQLLITSWDIKCKNDENDKFTNKKGILTLDDKFYIIEQNGKFMQSQINLAEATINETQNLGEIILKSKKKSKLFLKYLIQFSKSQNQDQFKLHHKKAQGLIL